MRVRDLLRNPTCRGATAGLLCALICWGLNGLPWVRALENWALDNCFLARGKRASHAKVMIVALDEDTLQQMHKPLMFISPELAEVVTYVHAHGAAAIGIDLLLPDSNKGRIRDLLPPNGIGNVERMGIAVGRAGNVVLPTWILSDDEPILPIYEWGADPHFAPWNRLGFVNFTVDPDRFFRRQQLRTVDNEGHVRPSFALAVFAQAHGLTSAWAAEFPLCLAGRPIPLDAEGHLTVNYVGPPGSLPSVPFHEVVAAARSGSPLDADFQDAVVVIGITARTGQDLYPTPYSSPSVMRILQAAWSTAEFPPLMPGVEVHANTIATLADRAFLTTPWWLATGWLLLLAGVVLGAILARISLEGGAILMFAHHWLWQAVCMLAFWYGHWRVESIAMLMLGILLYGSIFALRWRWIRRMMGMVKSEAIARELEASGSLDLGGEERVITVLFSDIRNFTPFSEKHTANEVVRFLNEFFTAIVPTIEKHGGEINLYVGDSVMVLYGAPKPRTNHALQAVQTAVAMVRQVHQLYGKWQQLGAADCRIGIGVHTGKAVVGTVGSPRRLDYTAIGDTVNTASRIESGTKELNTEILVSRVTYEAIPRQERQRLNVVWEKKMLQVKGKQHALEVYAIGLPQSEDAARQATLSEKC